MLCPKVFLIISILYCVKLIYCPPKKDATISSGRPVGPNIAKDRQKVVSKPAAVRNSPTETPNKLSQKGNTIASTKTSQNGVKTPVAAMSRQSGPASVNPVSRDGTNGKHAQNGSQNVMDELKCEKEKLLEQMMDLNREILPTMYDSELYAVCAEVGYTGFIFIFCRFVEQFV
ncbi:hypothetical protein DdX_09719 [Ditylenchus destructor]|uniref:Uncharacterized protein n=1 Tax=Ditylenchus destructor TaxID=166010 RepID=A0AAD4N010_9BILA|nr:hypothetical protein DdX_09719 [Ditylenchus destructor]